MAVDGCGLVCKYIIILFDCIFAVVGLAFLVCGLWLRFSGSTRPIFDIPELNSSTFVIGVTVLIALGAVMLIVVSFGDFGACSENRCSLQVFSCLVTILAGAEILIGVLAYTYRDEVQARVVEFYTSLYTLYVASSGDPALAVVLTFLHQTFHCCGLSGISLLELVKPTCPDPKGFLEQLKMPSCPSEIASVFDTRASIVLGTFLGTGALLIIVLICSLTLTKAIRVNTSSPQYILLNHSTPSAYPQPPQPALPFSIPYPLPNEEPVVFTPLTAANIPMKQA